MSCCAAARQLTLACVVLLGASGVVAATAEAAAAGPESPREQPDDPPAAVSRQELATAAPAAVVRGNHVSIQVNVDASGNNRIGDAANEPSLAIDPTNPGNIVIGWRQFDTVASNFRQAGWAFSHDGGATWTFPGVLQPGQFRSDPVLAADSTGAFFYYSLSSATSGEVFLSTNQGMSWAGPIDAFGGDKEWMTIDVTGGAGDGNVYAVWNSQFTCCAAGTDFTRSIDGGFTYEGPFGTPIKVKWGTDAVGPDGALYVAGANLNTSATPSHFVLRATNAFDRSQPTAFEHTTGVNLGGMTTAGGVPNPGGLLGQVWIAADRSAGPTGGNVYVLASVVRPGLDPQDVMFIRSTDRGVSWSAPVRVNDDPAGNGAYQWFAAMSVAPDGRIDATWYDTRSNASDVISEVYYAWSTDAGASWSSGLPVSPPFNSLVGHPNQNKIGDYTHMASDEDGAALAYAATFNGEQDVWFLRVGDCNANGAHDSADVGGGASPDCNGNRIPDECEPLVEICDDGSDQDCDALVDCADPDCFGDAACTCDLDGACEPGEDCTSCPSDCPKAGLACCGDLACEAGETPCTCPLDCGAFTPAEQACADGVDNDCDALLDCGDADCADPPPAPPASSPLLQVVRGEAVVTLRWETLPGALAFDVVQGDLAALRDGGGDFTGATTECVAAGAVGLEAYPEVFATSAWYLVRASFCQGAGSYDSGGSGQAAPRDAAIAASGAACP
jgi:hypothetical protein